MSEPGKPLSGSALKTSKVSEASTHLARTTFTAGRPPWYTSTGRVQQPLIIGVAGGSGSGKTTVCNAIVREVGLPWVSLVHMDSFYRPLTPEEREIAFRNEYNFDHPDAFDMNLLLQVIHDLKAGKSVNLPIYNFSTHSREEGNFQKLYGADVVILEGIFVLLDENIRNELDIKLFVDTEDDIRLSRRLRRDILERGRDVAGVLTQYQKFVKPAFEEFISPSKSFADVIVPRGADNHVAIGLIAAHVSNKLVELGWEPPKLEEIARIHSGKVHKLVDETIQSRQARLIMTLLRNKETHRMSRLLLERALEQIPRRASRTVQTPTGEKYEGIQLESDVCGVTIMRSGDVMSKPLQEMIRQIDIGTILIQFDESKVPRLYFYRLPTDLDKKYVMLLDPMIATGSTAIMALRLLLDHGVPEERIIFVTLIAAEEGIRRIIYNFPRIQIVTADIDKRLDAEGNIIPGLGHFGDRYFGTEPMEEEFFLEEDRVRLTDSGSSPLRTRGDLGYRQEASYYSSSPSSKS